MRHGFQLKYTCNNIAILLDYVKYYKEEFMSTIELSREELDLALSELKDPEVIPIVGGTLPAINKTEEIILGLGRIFNIVELVSGVEVRGRPNPAFIDAPAVQGGDELDPRRTVGVRRNDSIFASEASAAYYGYSRKGGLILGDVEVDLHRFGDIGHLQFYFLGVSE